MLLNDGINARCQNVSARTDGMSLQKKPTFTIPNLFGRYASEQPFAVLCTKVSKSDKSAISCKFAKDRASNIVAGALMEIQLSRQNEPLSRVKCRVSARLRGSFALQHPMCNTPPARSESSSCATALNEYVLCNFTKDKMKRDKYAGPRHSDD